MTQRRSFSADEARNLLRRNAAADDRRVRRLTLTPGGGALLAELQPGMLRAQERILAPLKKAERAEFMRLLRLLVSTNNELSRAPSDTL
jgi:DNA-binding MarR family transcriptional regulator